MRRKKEVKEVEEVEEVEEVKSFHLPASIRLYPAHTPDAARHGDNFTSTQQASAFLQLID